MTHEEKKKLILEKLANGDKRSYNEIQSDLELELWTARHKGEAATEKLLSQIKKTKP